jgi:hypothetical protein
MNKPSILLILIGALIGIGTILLFYGSQLITADLTIEEQTIKPGELYELSKDLTIGISSAGVYVVQTIDSDAPSIQLKIYDPLGNEIVSRQIDKKSVEDRFEITADGTYRLSIEVSGLDEIRVVAGFGHQPDMSISYVAISGFVTISVGLIGLVGFGVYAVSQRQKRKT